MNEIFFCKTGISPGSWSYMATQLTPKDDSGFRLKTFIFQWDGKFFLLHENCNLNVEKNFPKLSWDTYKKLDHINIITFLFTIENSGHILR